MARALSFSGCAFFAEPPGGHLVVALRDGEHAHDAERSVAILRDLDVQQAQFIAVR